MATGDPICSKCGAFKQQCVCTEMLINKPTIAGLNPELLVGIKPKITTTPMTKDKGIWYEFGIIIAEPVEELVDGIEPEEEFSKATLDIMAIEGWCKTYLGKEEYDATNITMVSGERWNVLYPYDAFAKLMQKHRGIVASKPPKAKEV